MYGGGLFPGFNNFVPGLGRFAGSGSGFGVVTRGYSNGTWFIAGASVPRFERVGLDNLDLTNCKNFGPMAVCPKAPQKPRGSIP